MPVEKFVFCVQFLLHFNYVYREAGKSVCEAMKMLEDDLSQLFLECLHRCWKILDLVCSSVGEY